MGRAARANPRSTDGGKPRAYCSFQRCIRAVRTFGDDRAGFVRWRDSTAAGEHQRAGMERIWSELHPAPLVTLCGPLDAVDPLNVLHVDGQVLRPHSGEPA